MEITKEEFKKRWDNCIATIQINRSLIDSEKFAEKRLESNLPNNQNSQSLQADIRNKLSPISNLISMLEDNSHWLPEAFVKNEIEKAKESVKYLSVLLNK
jgi:DNA-binding transcriptional regulator GbsR (MarR family)